MFIRFESSSIAAVLPDPRPPQTNTLPFRRSVFSAFASSLSIDTIFREDIERRGAGGDGSLISRPRVNVISSGDRG